MSRKDATLYIAATLATLLLGTFAFGAESDDSTPPRPEWCRVGYVCLRTQDAAALSVKLIDLQAENQLLKVKRLRTVGLAAVCGPSASLSVNNGTTDFRGTISCTIGYGLRW